MADDAPPPGQDGPDTAAASRIAAIFPDSPLSDVPDDAPGPAPSMKRSADEASPSPTPPPARKRARTSGAAAKSSAAAQGKLDEHQRRAVLRADPLARNVEANRVFCVECKKWVKLGEGVRYRVKHWAGHCALVHKRDKQTADAIEAEGVANAAKAAASPRASRVNNDPNGADDAGPSTLPPAPVAPRKLRDHSKAAARRKSPSPAAPAPALAPKPKPAPAPAPKPQPAQPPPPPPPAPAAQHVMDRQWQVLTAQNFVQPPPPPPQNPNTFSFALPPAPPQYTHAPDPYGFLPVLNGPMLGGEPVFMTFQHHPQPQPFMQPQHQPYAPPFAQQQQYAPIPQHFAPNPNIQPAPISHHHHQQQQDLGDDADADGSADEDAVGSPDPTA